MWTLTKLTQLLIGILFGVWEFLLVVGGRRWAFLFMMPDKFSNISDSQFLNFDWSYITWAARFSGKVFCQGSTLSQIKASLPSSKQALMSIPRMWMSTLTCGMNVNWKLVFQCELSEVVSQNQHQHLFAMFGWGNSLGAFCTLSWVLYSLNGSWFCRPHQLRWFQNNICTFAKNKICLCLFMMPYAMASYKKDRAHQFCPNKTNAHETTSFKA